MSTRYAEYRRTSRSKLSADPQDQTSFTKGLDMGEVDKMLEFLNVQCSPGKPVSSSTSIEKCGKHSRGGSYGHRASLEVMIGEPKFGEDNNQALKKVSAAQNYHRRNNTEMHVTEVDGPYRRPNQENEDPRPNLQVQVQSAKKKKMEENRQGGGKKKQNEVLVEKLKNICSLLSTKQVNPKQMKFMMERVSFLEDFVTKL